MTKKNTTKATSFDEAKKIIEAKHKEDEQKCSEEIKSVLEKHGCRMVMRGEYINGEHRGGILIVKIKQ